MAIRDRRNQGRTNRLFNSQLEEVMHKYITVAFLLLVAVFFQLNCSLTSALEERENSSVHLSEDVSATDVQRNLFLQKLNKIGEIPVGKGQPRLFLLNEKTGWLCREKEVWKTLDGGKNWKSVFRFNESDSSRILDIAFINELKGWIVTDDGVLSTDDGGLIWSPVSFFRNLSESVITTSIAVRGQKVIVGGSRETVNEIKAERSIFAFDPAIFYSPDSGRTWGLAQMPQSKGSISKVGFREDGTLLAIGEISNDIFTSLDGFTWKRENLNSPCIDKELRHGNEYKPVSLSFDKAGNAWISYNDGRIIFSDHFGHWCDIALPGDVWKSDDEGLAYFEKLCFINSEEGLGIKANGQVWETTTGGAEWNLVSNEIRFGDIVLEENKCVLAFDDGLYMMSFGKAYLNDKK